MPPQFLTSSSSNVVAGTITPQMLASMRTGSTSSSSSNPFSTLQPTSLSSASSDANNNKAVVSPILIQQSKHLQLPLHKPTSSTPSSLPPKVEEEDDEDLSAFDVPDGTDLTSFVSSFLVRVLIFIVSCA
jgi:hypothetical protein